ncbi:hypothetical protein RJT34_10147 [Clitoria ternatea]|uniref:RNase H type-1 domain-containing protein n=1 Tax=Clitoria ternatea TaxID=43366 RepID=A0AAN9K7Q5_CLITE
MQVLYDCSYAMKIWKSLVLEDSWVSFASLESYSWLKSSPVASQFKLNIDGSVRHNSLQAACGGLIRDHSGRFLKCFMANLGYCTSIKDELWAILKLAKESGLSNVIVG